MKFKDKLRKLRTEAELSQEALVYEVHISRSAIAKYENGNGNPSKETLKTLAFYFGVEVSELKSDEVIKNEKIKRNKIRWTSIIRCAFLIVGIITVSAIGVFNLVNNRNDRLEFSSERWKAENNYYERYLMLDSLSSSHDIRGYNINRLRDLLGSPDEIEQILLDIYPPQNGGCIYVYYIDSHVYSGARESLSVNISAKNIVVSCYYTSTNGKTYSIY